MNNYTSLNRLCSELNRTLGITNERYISKSKLKKVVYNFIYGQISKSMLDDMEKHNIKVSVYWHYDWWQPVVYIPPFCDYVDVLYELAEDLGWYCYE